MAAAWAKRQGRLLCEQTALGEDPATTYFPAMFRSIIGARGLTAVFGMGTGVAPDAMVTGKLDAWPIPGRCDGDLEPRSPATWRVFSINYAAARHRAGRGMSWVRERAAAALVRQEPRGCRGQAFGGLVPVG